MLNKIIPVLSVLLLLYQPVSVAEPDESCADQAGFKKILCEALQAGVDELERNNEEEATRRAGYPADDDQGNGTEDQAENSVDNEMEEGALTQEDLMQADSVEADGVVPDRQNWLYRAIVDSKQSRGRSTSNARWSCVNGICYGLNSADTGEDIENPAVECQEMARQAGGVSRFEFRDGRKLDTRDMVACNSGVKRSNGNTLFYYQALSRQGIVRDQTIIDEKNGISWRCLNGEFCWAAIADTRRDLELCRGFARKVGGVEYFWGNVDRRMSQSKLDQCNNGIDGYYYYTAVATRRFENQKTFMLGDIARKCEANTTHCTWRSKDATPSVEGCRKMRKKIGNIREYGYPGNMLNDSKIRQCNQG